MAEKQLKRYQLLLLSVTSGMLLWASWPVSPFTFLIFIAFVPFLLLAGQASSRLSFFGYAYLTLLIWNAATTWWICNSTVPGGIAAILANSLLMCIPWMGYYVVHKRIGQMPGYAALLAFWLTFEYIHLNWQLSWPWLTLGNVFATHPAWVQWYEYTGTSGGGLWIMSTNIALFKLLKNNYARGSVFQKKYLAVASLILFTPFIVSYLINRANSSQHTSARNFVVVQPNIDPYEKFQPGSQEGQLQLLIRLSESKIDANTAVVVWPETALNHDPEKIDLERLEQISYLEPVWDFLKKHPGLKLFSGIEGIRFFTNETKTQFSRATGIPGYYYDIYNAAALLDSNTAMFIYSKSKLVPGVETLPTFLKFLDKWFEQFGGTTGGYASQEERTVLSDPASGYKIAPAICYESIYGEFLTSYIRKGANVIAIITNDGWWANTSGHKQHMHYARLRAIESRRWIVRSANTGISCFISSEGVVYDARPWDTAAAIKMNIPPMEVLTFYVRHGDLISKICVGMAVILLLAITFYRVTGKISKKMAYGKND